MQDNDNYTLQINECFEINESLYNELLKKAYTDLSFASGVMTKENAALKIKADKWDAHCAKKAI